MTKSAMTRIALERLISDLDESGAADAMERASAVPRVRGGGRETTDQASLSACTECQK